MVAIHLLYYFFRGIKKRRALKCLNWYSMWGCVLCDSTFSTVDNFIDGTEFVNLTSGEVKQMVSPLGLAKKIIRMIPKVSVF